MLVLGLLPKSDTGMSLDDAYTFNHNYILMIYTQNKTILCDLDEELKKIQKNELLKFIDIGILTSIFQHTITTKNKLYIYGIQPEDFIKQIILKNKQVVYPHVWYDFENHYLDYYENHNYNKVNILKRNSGKVFAKKSRIGQYEPLYLNKELKYSINLKFGWISDGYLNYKLYEYFYDHNMTSAILGELYKSGIANIVLQFIQKIRLYEEEYAKFGFFSFLSSNTAIKRTIALVSSFSVELRSNSYRLYRTENEFDMEIVLSILYITRYKVYKDIETAEKSLLDLRLDIIENKDNLEIYLNLQIFLNIQVYIDESRYENKILCLRYIEIGFEKDQWQIRYAIIAPQSTINKSKIDKILSDKGMVKGILDLLRNIKYSNLGISHYKNKEVKLEHTCVFIYE